MRKINIFLALGEKDVRNDKNEIGSYINHLNEKYEDKDIYIRLITDDDLEKDLKSIINDEVNNSEIFFIIFGDSIKEDAINEFNLAYDKFKKESNPKIVTFSKKLDNRNESVTEFLGELGDKLGHYYNEYEHIDSIKLELVEQLESLGLKEFNLVTKDGYVYLNDEKVVSLDNIPMFFNNEHLTKLKEEYKELESKYWSLKRKIKKEPSEELEKQLQEVSENYINTKNNIEYLEKKIFSLGQTFVSISGKCILTEKQIYARECLENGDLEEAEKVLDIKIIEKDIKRAEELQEEVKNKIKGHIQELILRANTYKVDLANPNRHKEIIKSYECAIQAEKENGLPRDTLKIYAEYCEEQGNFEKAAELIELYIKYLESFQLEVDANLYLELENNYTMCNKFDDALKQYNIIKEILSKKFDELLYVKSELYHADSLAKQIENGNISFKIAHECPNSYKNLINYYYQKKLYYINDTYAYWFIKTNYHMGKYIKEYLLYYKSVFHYYMDTAVLWIEGKKFKDRSQFKDLDEMTMMIFRNYAEFQEEHMEYADALKYYEKAFDIVEKIFTDKPEVYSNFIAEILDKLNPLYDKYNLYERKIEYSEKYANIVENQIMNFCLKDNKQQEEFSRSLLINMVNKYTALIDKEGSKCSIEGQEKAIDYRKELIKELKKSSITYAKDELIKQEEYLKRNEELLEVIKDIEEKGIKALKEQINDGENLIRENKYKETIDLQTSFIDTYLKNKNAIKTWRNYRTILMFNELYNQIIKCARTLENKKIEIEWLEKQNKFLEDLENNGTNKKTLIKNIRINSEYDLAILYFNNKEFKKALKEFKKLESIQDILKKIRYDGYKEGNLEETKKLEILTLISLKKYKEAEELKYNTLKDLDYLISIYNDGKGANSKFRNIKLSILKETKGLHNEKSKYDEVGEIAVNVQDENGDNLKNASVLMTGDNYNYEADFNGNGIYFTRVKPGKYKATLTKIPKGYTVKEKEYIVDLGVGEVPELTFKLEKLFGKVSLQLLDDANNPLSGFKFKFYNEDLKFVKSLITNENGQFEDTFEAGYYYVQQTDGQPGYDLDERVFDFTISEEKREVKTTLYNKRHTGRLAIEVKDKKGNFIKNFKINLYNNQKEIMKSVLTNDKGQVGIKSIPLGTYYYQKENDEKMIKFQLKEKDEIVLHHIVV